MDATVAETLEIAQDEECRLIESYLEHGDELPDSIRELRDKNVEFRIPVNIG